MVIIPNSDYDPKQAEKNINNNIAKRSCLACDNFRACHPRTSLCYCMDESKAVFFDAGCSSWELNPKLKPASTNTAKE